MSVCPIFTYLKRCETEAWLVYTQRPQRRIPKPHHLLFFVPLKAAAGHSLLCYQAWGGPSVIPLALPSRKAPPLCLPICSTVSSRSGSGPPSLRREWHIVWKAALSAVGNPKGPEEWQHTENYDSRSSADFLELPGRAVGGSPAWACGSHGLGGWGSAASTPPRGF